MNRRSFALAAAALAAAAPARAQAPAGPTPAAVAAAAQTITPSDVYARIEYIASDLMRGRDTPSPELNLTAGYLVNQYKLMGFQPGGENGTFYQWYPFPLHRPTASAARVELGGAGALAAGSDYYAVGATASALTAPLVFVGGAPDEVMVAGSLAGKVAVAALPGSYSREWRAERTRQRRAAQRAGAVAVVHVLDAPWTADSVAKYAAQAQRPTRSLGNDLAFPEVFVTRAAAARAFAAARQDLASSFTRASQAGFRAQPLAGATATLSLPVEGVDAARAPNVIAILPGSDPVLRNEYVVLSAHMDHVGVGESVNGDSIYNGADDDASGTTGILEVAQAFASLPVRPRRSIAIVHVSGEEKGLVGSEWFSEHPTLPLAQIVADINIDMIGRNNPDSVVVIGKDFSSLGATTNAVNRAHPELHLTAADDIWPQERFFFRSDHFNFARKEVPAIFFFSGVHEDYHRPSDEVAKIDTDKAARIARLAFYLANEVANAPQRPRWDPRGLEEVRRLTR